MLQVTGTEFFAMTKRPSSKGEFEAAMRQIDDELIAAGFGVPVRLLRAGLIYAKRFGVDIPWPYPRIQPTDGVYTGESLAAHMQEWFDRRYGDRQKAFLGPGSTVILLRGDPWEMRMPLIFGTVTCVVDPDLDKYRNSPSFAVSQPPPPLNILTLINELPVGLAGELSQSECLDVMRIFQQALDCFQSIGECANLPYAAEAQADLRASVSQLIQQPPHPGQSKWASAQAAEKFVKGLLGASNIKFRFGHDLDDYLPLAAPLGLRVGGEVVSHLKTPASVRYGEPVTIREAVYAHHAALLVGRAVASARLASEAASVDPPT